MFLGYFCVRWQCYVTFAGRYTVYHPLAFQILYGRKNSITKKISLAERKDLATVQKISAICFCFQHFTHFRELPEISQLLDLLLKYIPALSKKYDLNSWHIHLDPRKKIFEKNNLTFKGCSKSRSFLRGKSSTRSLAHAIKIIERLKVHQEDRYDL